MLGWSCASLLLIVLLHNLYLFFLTTLTVPKIKDLVNKPAARYKEFFAEVDLPLLPPPPPPPPPIIKDFTMQNELSTFLKDLKTGNQLS
jgi:hypothetical protein